MSDDDEMTEEIFVIKMAENYIHSIRHQRKKFEHFLADILTLSEMRNGDEALFNSEVYDEIIKLARFAEKKNIRMFNKHLKNKTEEFTKKKEKGNRVKQPKNAFFFFKSDASVLAKLHRQNPDVRDQPTKSILLGRMWQSMSADAKRPYQQLASDDSKRYIEELKTRQEQEEVL